LSRPWLVARGLVSVRVLVPIVGVATARAFGLTLEAQVGWQGLGCRILRQKNSYQINPNVTGRVRVGTSWWGAW
jgi:hypothetical protein